MKIWRTSLLLLALCAPAVAQQQGQPVVTIPYPATTAGGNASGTVTVTNTFQQLWAGASPLAPRHGCMVQNNGTHSMWVSEGTTIAGSLSTNSVILAANGIFYCTPGGENVALQGQVNITGTANDPFYAVQY